MQLCLGRECKLPTLSTCSHFMMSVTRQILYHFNQEQRGRVWFWVLEWNLIEIPCNLSGHDVSHEDLHCVLHDEALSCNLDMNASFQLFPHAAMSWGVLPDRYCTTSTKHNKVECGFGSGAGSSLRYHATCHAMMCHIKTCLVQMHRDEM